MIETAPKPAPHPPVEAHISDKQPVLPTKTDIFETTVPHTFDIPPAGALPVEKGTHHEPGLERKRTPKMSLEEKFANLPPLEGLPIYQDENRKKIIDAIHLAKRPEDPHNMVVIAAGTGVGKTRGASTIALEALGPKSKMVATETLRKVAEDSAEVVSFDNKSKVGEMVGVRNKYMKAYNNDTRLLFCPVQSLMIMMEEDKLLSNYDAVFLDEVHKTDVDYQITMMELENINKQRKDRHMNPLVQIWVSATPDKELINERYPNAHWVEVPGVRYEIERKFADKVYHPKELPGKAAEKVKEVIESGTKDDILVFLSGDPEIRKAMDQFKTYNIPDVVSVPYSGARSQQELQKLNQSAGDKVKVIWGTNSLQEGVTTDARSVINTARHKEIQLDKATGAQLLVETDTPQAHDAQREGRVGRKPRTDGKKDQYYALTTEEAYYAKPQQELAAIKRKDLTGTTLQLIAMGYDPYTAPYITAPPKENLDIAVKRLQMTGVLDAQRKLAVEKDEQGNIYNIGEFVAKAEVSPNLARMVEASTKYGDTKRVAALAAIMEEYPRALDPKKDDLDPKTKSANTLLLPYRDSKSEVMGILQLFQDYMAVPREEQWEWAQQRGLKGEDLKNAATVYNKLIKEVKNYKKNIDLEAPAPTYAMERSIAQGFADRIVFYSSPDFSYKLLGFGNDDITIDIDQASLVRRYSPSILVTMNLEPQENKGQITQRIAKMNHAIPMEILPPAIQEMILHAQTRHLPGRSKISETKSDQPLVEAQPKETHPVTQEGLLQRLSRLFN